MTKNNGISLDGNKLIIDDDGSIHVSYIDSLTGDISWTKVASSNNDLLEGAILSEVPTYRARLDMYNKSPNTTTINPNKALHNSSVNDTDQGLKLPSTFSAELPETGYRKLDSPDELVYTVKSTLVDKLPQFLSQFNVVEYLDRRYGSSLWKLLGLPEDGANPGQYFLYDKVAASKSLIREIRFKSVGSSSMSSYMAQVHLKGGYSGTAGHSSSGISSVLVNVPSNNIGDSIDDNGMVSFVTYGPSPLEGTESVISVDYVSCYLYLGVTMQDIYLSKFSLEEIAPFMRTTRISSESELGETGYYKGTVFDPTEYVTYM